MKNQGLVTIQRKSKKTQKQLTEIGADFTQTSRGGVVLNLDNDESRRAVEMCYRTRKTLVNPIIDWDEDDVWEFIKEYAKVPYCELYDEGFTRLGCIGCPLQRAEGMKRDFERYPKYKEAYIRAFEKMLEKHPDFRAIEKDEPRGGGETTVRKQKQFSNGGAERTAETETMEDWAGSVRLLDLGTRERTLREKAEAVMRWWTRE